MLKAIVESQNQFEENCEKIFQCWRFRIFKKNRDRISQSNFFPGNSDTLDQNSIISVYIRDIVKPVFDPC